MKLPNLTVISNVLSVGKKRLLFATRKKKLLRARKRNDETERCVVSFSFSEKKREKKGLKRKRV